MGYTKIVFGTDGWRGQIAENYTFSAVRRCAQGFAKYILANNYEDKPIVIGYDRRFASEDFAKAAAEVLSGNGIQVLLTDQPTPTPTISYAVVAKNAAGAINITASHNPYSDNGFKVRNQYGGAIAPEGLRAIEAEIPSDDVNIPHLPFSQAIRKGMIELFDPKPAYIQQIERLVNLAPLREAGLKIMIDPMWGNGANWFSELLQGDSIQVMEIHNERNPLFPEMTRPEPIPPNIDVGLQTSLAQSADVLIITDGDADRVGLGDEHGRFIDQLRVYGLLAYYMLEIRQARGPIVKTLSTTSMLNKLGSLYDVPVYETGVGFKYVAPKMLEVEAMIGGEESGGYAFQGHVPERDGILAGLYLLDMMVQLDAKPSQLVKTLFDVVGAHFYDRIDTPLPDGERAAYEKRILNADPKTIGGLKVTGLNTLDGYKFELEDGGWLLIRFSGTEPIVRVYCETLEEGRVEAILQDGLDIVGIQ
jgi:phosphomannomutase